MYREVRDKSMGNFLVREDLLRECADCVVMFHRMESVGKGDVFIKTMKKFKLIKIARMLFRNEKDFVETTICNKISRTKMRNRIGYKLD